MISVVIIFLGISRSDEEKSLFMSLDLIGLCLFLEVGAEFGNI
jgi:hypothetical protein